LGRRRADEKTLLGIENEEASAGSNLPPGANRPPAVPIAIPVEQKSLVEYDAIDFSDPNGDVMSQRVENMQAARHIAENLCRHDNSLVVYCKESNMVWVKSRDKSGPPHASGSKICWVYEASVAPLPPPSSDILVVAADGVDFGSPGGDICHQECRSESEARAIANEMCMADDIVVVYGKDCNIAWIKKLSLSGVPTRQPNRVSFLRKRAIYTYDRLDFGRCVCVCVCLCLRERY
jgi:hypothetical protein